MTVVLAIACSDGVVVAADTQVTDQGRGMTYPAQKLHLLGDRAAWGGSGARSVLRELQQQFDESPAGILDAPDIGRALQQRVLPVLRYHYENFITEVPGSDTGSDPSAYVLAAGWTNDEPWIVEIDPHGMIGRYEDIGFHAIGSGAAMAQQAGALLAHFHMLEREVDYGVVAAIRVLDALTQTSPSVGDPLHVCRITAEGSDLLGEDRIQEVRKLVDRWTDLEQQALDDLFD